MTINKCIALWQGIFYLSPDFVNSSMLCVLLEPIYYLFQQSDIKCSLTVSCLCNIESVSFIKLKGNWITVKGKKDSYSVLHYSFKQFCLYFSKQGHFAHQIRQTHRNVSKLLIKAISTSVLVIYLFSRMCFHLTPSNH